MRRVSQVGIRIGAVGRAPVAMRIVHNMDTRTNGSQQFSKSSLRNENTDGSHCFDTLGYFTFRVVQREVYYVYVENTRGSANATRDYCAAAGGFAGLKKSSLRGMFLPVLTHSKSNK